MWPIPVLLVDDNRAFLRVLTGFLRDESREEFMVVASVSDSREAIAQASATQPEVVLLDLNMPHISGLALLPRLREQMPQATIVMLTLSDGADVHRATRALGADGFVSKLTDSISHAFIICTGRKQ